MRTTLQLDDDVLDAARVLDRQRQTTIGYVNSDLARQTLSRPVGNGPQNDGVQPSGLPQLPVKASGCVVDSELVNQLREEEA
jgi:hypothetical protein